jgi:XRE family transcriptional regulator, aerobic/anaerobic benzoate catabolism transcriptional regulator
MVESIRTTNDPTITPGAKNPILVSLGDQVRLLRSRLGMTRKALALESELSERHLANLEYGVGNPSVLVLAQVAGALHCSVAELIGDVSTSSPEWLLIRGLLEKRDEAQLRQARLAITDALSSTPSATGNKRNMHIALIGLRGAGKSTLGKLLAEDLGFRFVELGREIEALAGCNVAEIQALYGANAYRRYERRALEECLKSNKPLVMAAPGGIVADTSSFNLLLSQCTTIWLQSEPEDHMRRVTSQGDMRPIQASSEAMEDLKRILAGRSAFYSKAEFHLNTSHAPLDQTFVELRAIVRSALDLDNVN